MCITAYEAFAKAEGLNGASFEEGPLLLRGQSALLEQIYDWPKVGIVIKIGPKPGLN